MQESRRTLLVKCYRRFAGLVALYAFSLPAWTAAAEPTSAPSAAPTATTAAPDYAQAANWICRPDAEDACTAGLDAKIDTPQGPGATIAFSPANDAPIDCFYVYPTVSQEERVLSDLEISPEIREVANHQAGRLASRCRLFAPVYRQITIFGLRRMMSGGAPESFDESFGDIAAAWTYYLAHDNGGRGVVLVGHSQGTILLQRLIAEMIDGTPQQKLLVSAFLAGDPSLAIPHGKKAGGTFKHVPVCSSAAQTGCAYAWGSYLSNDTSPIFRFGTPLDNGLVSACVNPAAPAGGAASLKFFHKKAPDAPASDPPWVETLGQLTGKCRSDMTGDGFIVSVRPGRKAARLKQRLEDAEIVTGWGLHLEDVALVQGNMLDVLGAEIATWTKVRPAQKTGATKGR